MSSTKPTLLFIPSSFCPSSLLNSKTIDMLHASGYDSLAIELPSVGPPSTAPPKTMTDDAAHIAGIIEYLANQGMDVILVMHGYGGVPGTQAVEGLSKKERASQGKSGGVSALVYISGLLVKQGENSGESLAPFSGFAEFFRIAGEYLYLEPVGAAAGVFAELPKDQGEAFTRKMPGQAMAAFQGKLTSTSHYDVPVTYVKCTNDTAVVPAHQQKMIDDFKAVSRSSVDVVELASGHAPMVAHVEKTVEVIVSAAGKV